MIWIISRLDSIPSLDGMDKIISVIHWRAQKQHEDFTAYQYGALYLGTQPQTSFIPYDDITKETVEGWLESILDTEAIEANLDAQIENFLNPPIKNYGLPWQSNNIS